MLSLLLIAFIQPTFAQTAAESVIAPVAGTPALLATPAPAAALPAPAVPAQTTAPTTAPKVVPLPSSVIPQASSVPPASTTDSADEGEYEIDYEEEPEAGDEPSETPAPRNRKHSQQTKTARTSSGGGPAVQGSRAKHRFTPILKSETKSIYHREGKILDVDSD